jgi:hypothetical protein
VILIVKMSAIVNVLLIMAVLPSGMLTSVVQVNVTPKNMSVLPSVMHM